jgi:hypothetical protein
MRRNRMKWLVLAGMLVPSLSYGQQNCASGIRVEVTITDPTATMPYYSKTGKCTQN